MKKVLIWIGCLVEMCIGMTMAFAAYDRAQKL